MATLDVGGSAYVFRSNLAPGDFLASGPTSAKACDRAAIRRGHATSGFRANGMIVAVSCVLVLTYRKWQVVGSGRQEMRPTPFLRRIA